MLQGQSTMPKSYVYCLPEIDFPRGLYTRLHSALAGRQATVFYRTPSTKNDIKKLNCDGGLPFILYYAIWQKSTKNATILFRQRGEQKIAHQCTQYACDSSTCEICLYYKDKIRYLKRQQQYLQTELLKLQCAMTNIQTVHESNNDLIRTDKKITIINVCALCLNMVILILRLRLFK